LHKQSEYTNPINKSTYAWKQEERGFTIYDLRAEVGMGITGKLAPTLKWGISGRRSRKSYIVNRKSAYT
jgi:hypothetical protein